MSNLVVVTIRATTIDEADGKNRFKERSLKILRDSIRGKDAAVRWYPKLEVEISRV